MLIWLDEIRERLSITTQLRRCEQKYRKRSSKTGCYCDYTKRSVRSFTVSPPPVELSQWLTEARRHRGFPNLRAVFRWRGNDREVDWRNFTGQFFSGLAFFVFLPDTHSVATATGAQGRNGGRDMPVNCVRRDTKAFPNLHRIEMLGDAFKAFPLSRRQRDIHILTHNGNR